MNTLELYNLLAEKSATTLTGYLDYLVCDSRPPKRLKHILEPWQQTLYSLLIPLFETAAGLQTSAVTGAFITAPRGHSKTSTVAQLLNWCLCFSKRQISITAAAADKDQAGILLDRMKKEAEQNSWLAKKLRFKHHRVKGPTGALEVLSADAPSASGRLDDIIVLDEVSWWKKRDLFDILASGRNKRKDGVMVVISNSGVKNSWQHELWLQAQQSERWITHEIPPYSASWLNQEAIKDDRKLLLPSIYKRLHENKWVDLQEECGYVTREQMESCVKLKSPCWEGEAKTSYVAAVDVGLVNDRTCLVIVHGDNDDVVLDRMEVWQGNALERVQLHKIEEWLDEAFRKYNITELVLDAYQLEQIAQKYERRVEVERFAFGGGNHFRLAENLRTLIINNRLSIYPSAGGIRLSNGKTEDLVDEMSQLVTVEKNGGTMYRVDHVPGMHDDRYVTLAMASLAVVRSKQKSNPLTMLEEINKTTVGLDGEMDYAQVKKIECYGTWQVCPVVNGNEYRLNDYSIKDEAAFAVNEVHKLLQGTPPNALDANRMPSVTRQGEIRADVAKVLREKGISVPVPKDKKK